MTLVRLCSLATLLAVGCTTPDGSPCEICVDDDVFAGAGALFVSDRGGSAILRFDAVTGEFRDVFAAGDRERVDRPSSVRLGPDGAIYMASFGDAEIVRYDALSAHMMDVFYRNTIELEEPVELLFHDDQLVVLGNDTNNVVVLDPAGALIRNFGAPDMLGAYDCAFGPDGLLYVGVPSHVDHGTAVQVWDVTTGQLVRHFGTYDQLASATGIAFGDEWIYVADHERNQVVRFDAVTGGPRGVLIDRGLDAPVSLELGPDGALYIVDAEGVKRFDGTTLSPFIATGPELRQPRSITFVSDEMIAATRHE